MSEFWDLYDKDRRPLNRTHERGRYLEKGTYHIAVGIWTVNDKNEVLLTLRSPDKRDWPNMWENTAGSLLCGETSVEGAMRELKEETGITVSESELHFIATERTRNAFGDCYMVRKNVPIEDIVLQEGETCDAKWVSLNTLDQMIDDGLVAPPVASRLARIRDKFEEFIFHGEEGKDIMRRLPFGRADILLPKKNHEKWAVVACDQYTSQPEYWVKAAEITDGYPSALNIILPEVYLEEGNVDERIENINATMDQYLSDNVFDEYKNSMIFVERTLSDGRVRRGIVGAIDLEAYDYNVGSVSAVRATEGTVLSRIPPRVKIRKNAPLELPHIMILIDDPENKVIPSAPDSQIVYDCPLMLKGGHIRGSLMSDEAIEKAEKGLNEQWNKSELLFAMGDGNHSLATAKACYEADKSNPLARYALCEIVNIHDPALDFEPIYRVVFGVDPTDIINKAKKCFEGQSEHRVDCVFGESTDHFYADGLTAGVLQGFIDEYIAEHDGASVDYIHGEDSVRELVDNGSSVGFIFDGIAKSELFAYVDKNGALPRKTFSMGEAYDKRYYMECRKIK